VSSILDATAIFIPSFAFLLVLPNTLLIFISQHPFSGSKNAKWQPFSGFEGALRNSSGYFYFAGTFAKLPAKLRQFFFQETLPREIDCEIDPPIFRGRLPATENSLCETAIQAFEFRGETLVW
jgi:hypothetical protein